MGFSDFLNLLFGRRSGRAASSAPSAVAGAVDAEWAIVGLGNPGRRYQATRHNIGDRVACELARRHGSEEWADRGDAVEQMVRIHDRAIVLVRPLTFMNRSGQAAVAAIERHHIPLQQMLVVVDDIDLPLGRLRLKAAGGPGTHNGLRDIVKALGTGFPRLRMGIRGADPGSALADYVLSPFEEFESSDVEAMVQRAADGVESSIDCGVDRAMGEVNRKSVSQLPKP